MKNTQHKHQHGFAAIAAIFLIVILAALGAFMVTFSNTQQLTSAQDVKGSRAYWAASAGLEWGIANAVCPLPQDTKPSFDGDFTVTVTCIPQSYTEAGESFKIFNFTAVAKTSGAVGSMGYIERSMSAAMNK